MNYIIRKMRRKDSFDLAHVLTISWNETYKGIVPDWFLRKLKANEKERGQNTYDKFSEKANYKYVLEINNKVVGFVSYGKSYDKEYSNCGEIYALYIIDKYHGNGSGRKLVEKAKEELKKLGFNKMIIRCLKENPSNTFYEHMGGVHVKDSVYKNLNLPENIYFYEKI